jgi:hypothetical protein
MRAQPFDEDNSAFVINGYDEPIRIALDIEDDPVCAHNTGMGITCFDFGGIPPFCVQDFLIPGIQRGFYNVLVSVPMELFDKSQQCASGNNAHKYTISCSQIGYNRYSFPMQDEPEGSA